jgi:AraC-like DNA-binding protein
LSGTEKYKLFLKYVETGNWSIPKFGLFVLLVHVGVYCILAGKKIMTYKNHINNTSSFIDETYHRWLLFFISSSSFPILVLSLNVLFDFDYVSLTSITFSIVFFMTSVYLVALFKPTLFHTFPNQVNIMEEEAEEKQKYENSNLLAQEKDSLSQQLVRHLQSEKPFKQPELTLRELSEQINTRPYYLSQVINETLNTNFLDFINQYRVEEAKALLHDPKFDQFTVIAIAFESGFNSKSAFYNAFKKFTGTTPSKFRKLLVNHSL